MPGNTQQQSYPKAVAPMQMSQRLQSTPRQSMEGRKEEEEKFHQSDVQDVSFNDVYLEFVRTHANSKVVFSEKRHGSNKHLELNNLPGIKDDKIHKQVEGIVSGSYVNQTSITSTDTMLPSAKRTRKRRRKNNSEDYSADKNSSYSSISSDKEMRLSENVYPDGSNQDTAKNHKGESCLNSDVSLGLSFKYKSEVDLEFQNKVLNQSAEEKSHSNTSLNCKGTDKPIYQAEKNAKKKRKKKSCLDFSSNSDFSCDQDVHLNEYDSKYLNEDNKNNMRNSNQVSHSVTDKSLDCTSKLDSDVDLEFQEELKQSSKKKSHSKKSLSYKGTDKPIYQAEKCAKKNKRKKSSLDFSSDQEVSLNKNESEYPNEDNKNNVRNSDQVTNSETHKSLDCPFKLDSDVDMLLNEVVTQSKRKKSHSKKSLKFKRTDNPIYQAEKCAKKKKRKKSSLDFSSDQEVSLNKNESEYPNEDNKNNVKNSDQVTNSETHKSLDGPFKLDSDVDMLQNEVVTQLKRKKSHSKKSLKFKRTDSPIYQAEKCAKKRKRKKSSLDFSCDQEVGLNEDESEYPNENRNNARNSDQATLSVTGESLGCSFNCDSDVDPEFLDEDPLDEELSFSEKSSNSNGNNEPDYQKSLDHILLEHTGSRKSYMKEMKGMSIQLSHIPPALHVADVKVCTTPKGKDKVILESLGMKKEKFNKNEDLILMDNWKEFIKIHDILVEDTSYFMTMLNKPEPFKRYFLQFLGKGLNDRSLYQIYQRFLRLIHSKTGRYSAKEDQIILKVIKSNMNNPYHILSRTLMRPRDSIYNRFKMLQATTADTKSFKSLTQKWNKQLAESVVKSLLKVTKEKSVHIFENVIISTDVWRKIGEELYVPHWKLRQFWRYRLHTQLFAKEPVKESNICWKIVKWLHKMKPFAIQDIRWAESAHLFAGSTSSFMWLMFRRLKTRYEFPKFKTLTDFVSHLYDLRNLYDLIKKTNEKVYMPRYEVNEDGSFSIIPD